MTVADFLSSLEARPVAESHPDIESPQLYLGPGGAGVEVVVGAVQEVPRQSFLREQCKKRQGGRPSPVLLVLLHGDRCGLAAATAGDPEAWLDLDPGHVERLCRAALSEPNRHAALRFLAAHLPEIGSLVPGLRNEGLFSMHQLVRGVPGYAEWPDAKGRALPIRERRGKALVESLGFRLEPLKGDGSLLLAASSRRAVAIFLDRSEEPEAGSARFGGRTPIGYGLHRADQEKVPYVFLSTGAGLRLYPAGLGTGVGQRGRTETFVDLHLDLLDPEQSAYLWLLFSTEALQEGGSIERILDDSRRYATDLGTRLRDRIYSEVMPRLSEAIFRARRLRKPAPEDLRTTYQIALTTLFRLLFIAYAEDQDLLPFRTNAAYREKALKTLTREALDQPPSAGERWARGIWSHAQELFRAVDRGKPEWGVPAYNGGLFSSESEVSPSGAALACLEIPDEEVAPVFQALMVDTTPEGKGPVDFRSLGVREFGTIYEGLLESQLWFSEEDLVVEKGRYRSARKGEKPVVKAGEAYLGTPSGLRKSMGSFFTKPFAVEHLLENALEPALARHLARLNGLKDVEEAGKAFFDFRVADLAMGSGHFLVAAVDRIERRFSSYLADRPLPYVAKELGKLRESAREALGELADTVDLEDTQLLRRQIARRCIYGVDLNPEAVDLCRLSLWVHTFVPGLPLSVLDHHIVRGNSLVGIGTIREAEEEAEKHLLPMFAGPTRSMIEKARGAAERLGVFAEADAAEIGKAREVLAAERKLVRPVEALYDLLVAARIDPPLGPKVEALASEWGRGVSDPSGGVAHKAARKILDLLAPLHFPLVFPEVFSRQEPGFDCIVGNPPWEEAMLEEDDYWSRWEPGFQGLPQHEREKLKQRYHRQHPDLFREFQEEQARADVLRRALVAGGYPGMGTGDPDTYKAFAWRFWNLSASPGGQVGVVLPRSALSAKGSGEWRKELFARSKVLDVTILLNTGGWVFDGVEPRYTIALFSFRREGGEGRSPAAPLIGEPSSRPLYTTSDFIPLRGPYAEEGAYRAGIAREPVRWGLAEVSSATDTAALPLLPSEFSAEVLLQIMKAPRLDLDDRKSWRIRPYRELDATNDKPLMKFAEECPDGYWPVFKGESFDIWKNDTGTYYAWADPERVQKRLIEKRIRSAKKANSPFGGFDKAWIHNPKTLPCLHPRIAFRDVTNRTNSRTVLAALLPPGVFVTNAAPYLIWPRGDESDHSFLLGVLCSIPLDWYARRWVETHVNFHVLNAFPVPRPPRENPLWKRTVALAGRLAAQDRRLRIWARAVGVECGKTDEEEEAEMVAELDAVVALLYGLSEQHVRHIFETFHEGWDFAPRLSRVLVHYASWKKRSPVG